MPIFLYNRQMFLRLRDKLKRSRRLQLAVVATLSFALLALPCTPLSEVLGSTVGYAAAVAAPAHPAHHHTRSTDPTKEHESNCCSDCSTWLTTRFDDGSAAIITHNWSRSDIVPVALPHAPLVTDKSARERQFTGPPSVAFVDGTSVYAKTHRYRI